MVAALVVLLILVGLPLLAYWLGGRRRWARLDALGRDQMQAEREWMSRHLLDHREVAEVSSALNWGRAVPDERLRAAVVERARMVQDAERAWQQDRPRLTTAMRWLSAAWLLLLITAVVFAVAFGNWPGGSFFYLLVAVGSIGAGWWRRRNLQRAIELNGG
ncbi:hypothetical protein [Blastococcus goldschmidtiae]|uniref:Uncharacterized protein n=1 Tax=Blastococcus goldschmidtiae TaxID=3075546 RepID=A0ABU2KDL0_9ACTN|nr:hypothetical protein [Blastococcus sp. DSM 46792]MDT0278252.1 hypothetical protein [Blastococcus sp. DSM 46792]